MESLEHNPVQALPSDSSESEKDLEESDHGCEVRGAGADKSKKPKKKAAVKAAGKRNNQKKTNDILPEEVSNTLKSKHVASKKKPMLNLHKKLTKMVPNHPNQQRLPKHLLK